MKAQVSIRGALGQRPTVISAKDYLTLFKKIEAIERQELADERKA